MCLSLGDKIVSLHCLQNYSLQHVLGRVWLPVYQSHVVHGKAQFAQARAPHLGVYVSM